MAIIKYICSVIVFVLVVTYIDCEDKEERYVFQLGTAILLCGWIASGSW